MDTENNNQKVIQQFNINFSIIKNKKKKGKIRRKINFSINYSNSKKSIISQQEIKLKSKIDNKSNNDININHLKFIDCELNEMKFEDALTSSCL